MANLADMPHFQILKRWARRYTEQLKNKSFRLNPEDEHFLVKHTRHIEQAVGMELLIKAVEDARKQLNQEDNAS